MRDSPMGEWLLSRRDRLIVARHAVPGGAIFPMTPGTSCLATIMLSLWDKIHSPRGSYRQIYIKTQN
jgi:hypothetical protein